MAKPTKIPVLGTQFKINYGKLSGGDYGETLGNKREFKIDAKLKDEPLKSTLIHEITHGGFHVSGLSELLEKYDDSGHLEEAIVIMIEHLFTPIVELKLDNN